MSELSDVEKWASEIADAVYPDIPGCVDAGESWMRAKESVRALVETKLRLALSAAEEKLRVADGVFKATAKLHSALYSAMYDWREGYRPDDDKPLQTAEREHDAAIAAARAAGWDLGENTNTEPTP